MSEPNEIISTHIEDTEPLKEWWIPVYRYKNCGFIWQAGRLHATKLEAEQWVQEIVSDVGQIKYVKIVLPNKED